MDLLKKRVLVTGGSCGIGRAIAKAFVDRKSQVAITGRDSARLEEAAAELGCAALPGDVGLEADVQRTVAQFVEQFGGVDILINNAGFGHFAPLVEMETSDFEAVFRTNVLGAFLMAREVARHLVPQRSGAIVNVSSTSGLRGGQRSTAYSGSKFALRGMNECWREELRRHDVRVILVNPSEVLTEFAQRAGHGQEASPKKLRPEDIAEAVIAALELNARGFIPEFSVFATNPF